MQVLKDGLSALHVPYAYGFAIILLTVIVKIATLPLTKKQVSNYVIVSHKEISWIFHLNRSLYLELSYVPTIATSHILLLVHIVLKLRIHRLD